MRENREFKIVTRRKKRFNRSVLVLATNAQKAYKILNNFLIKLIITNEALTKFYSVRNYFLSETC